MISFFVIGTLKEVKPGRLSAVAWRRRRSHAIVASKTNLWIAVLQIRSLPHVPVPYGSAFAAKGEDTRSHWGRVRCILSSVDRGEI